MFNRYEGDGSRTGSLKKVMRFGVITKEAKWGTNNDQKRVAEGAEVGTHTFEIAIKYATM